MDDAAKDIQRRDQWGVVDGGLFRNFEINNSVKNSNGRFSNLGCLKIAFVVVLLAKI